MSSSSRELEIELPLTIAREFILALVGHVDVGSGRDVSDIEIKGDSVVLKGRDPVEGLRNAIDIIADYIYNQINSGIRVRLPLSGNDRKLLQEAFKCYQVTLEASPDVLIRQISSNIYKVKCVASKGKRSPRPLTLKLPSILKPEMYEYTRTSGYLGRRVVEDEYPVESVVLALIGYLGAKAGYIPEEDEAVVLLPPDDGSYPHEYFLHKYSGPLRSLRKKQINRRMVFPGINPEPALLLWLALQLPNTEKINLVSIKEPVGMEPASLSAYLSLNLESVRSNSELWKCLTEANRDELVERILEKALTPNPQQRSSLAIKASIWLYETLVGVRKFEEVIYMMSRDYVSALLGGIEIEREDIRAKLARLAKRLHECYY